MKNLKIFLLLTAAVFAACDRSDDGLDPVIEKRVEGLLSRMTLEEKIGQMNQLSSSGQADAMAEHVRSGAVGSILNEVNPEVVNELQRVAVEESRLGIPLIVGRDVIHGFRTIFPIPLGQAATFDPAIVEQGARIAAVEASAVGVRWTFSPMVDVSRDPRWGRIAESAGEDPYLSGVMGAAMVRGYQGRDYADPTSMAACVKHFAGYGASEGGRDYNPTYIPPYLLRNVYLPPFEACAQAGALTFMTSFNDNDGIPATGDRFLLRDVLRDEWGFRGFVVSDWNAIGQMISQGYAADVRDAALKAVEAGTDMDMMTFAFARHLKNLVEEGVVSERTIDQAVRAILRVKVQLGLFEHPYVDPARVAAVTYTEESLAAAKQAAAESVILLQNENSVLPLDAKRVKRLLVTGPMADDGYEQMGTWTFDGEWERSVTPLAALRAAWGDRMQIVYDPVLPLSRSKAAPGALERLTAKARGCDAVVVFVGEEAILSGESHCLTGLDLQGDQSALIEAAHRSGKPVVTVVMAGRPLTIGRDLPHTDALLYSFHPGTMGGPALADLLFGVAVPSGKSPVTFPKAVGQIPAHYNHPMGGRPATGREVLLEDIPVRAPLTSLGCRSYYLDAGFGPLFPFGYGLSYTTFEYTNLHLDRESYPADGTIAVTFDLANTGAYDATETVQVYVRDMVGSLTRPVKELKAFERVTLRAGEKREIRIELPVERLAFYGRDMVRRVEPGQFQLWVAGNSADGEPVSFVVE